MFTYITWYIININQYIWISGDIYIYRQNTVQISLIFYTNGTPYVWNPRFLHNCDLHFIRLTQFSNEDIWGICRHPEVVELFDTWSSCVKQGSQSSHVMGQWCCHPPLTGWGTLHSAEFMTTSAMYSGTNPCSPEQLLKKSLVHRNYCLKMPKHQSAVNFV